MRKQMDKVSKPCPNKKDNPFKEGFYGQTQVNLDWLERCCSPKDSIISEGFKEAADKIVDNLKTGRNYVHPDKSFFPIVYLYRHAFELCLKCIIRNGIKRGIITKDNSVEKMLTYHDLQILWNKARCVLENRWPNGNKEDLTSSERIILKFHKHFPSGQECRYAEDIKGNPNLENAPKLVDLVHLKKVANDLYSFLHACILFLEDEFKGNY